MGGMPSSPEDETNCETTTPLHSHTPTSIIRTALLLQTLLPADLIPPILDFAELWTPFVASVVQHPLKRQITMREDGQVQVRLEVPKGVPRGCVRRVKFRTVSRDQGWTAWKERGSYEGSRTWFEARVGATEGVSRPSGCLTTTDCGQTRLAPPDALKRHDSGVDCSLTSRASENGMSCSRRIVTNIHGGREFKEHEVVWDTQHQDEEIGALVKRSQGGSVLEVTAHAPFYGWVNEVKGVSVVVECAVVRRM